MNNLKLYRGAILGLTVFTLLPTLQGCVSNTRNEEVVEEVKPTETTPIEPGEEASDEDVIRYMNDKCIEIMNQIQSEEVLNESGKETLTKELLYFGEMLSGNQVIGDTGKTIKDVSAEALATIQKKASEMLFYVNEKYPDIVADVKKIGSGFGDLFDSLLERYRNSKAKEYVDKMKEQTKESFGSAKEQTEKWYEEYKEKSKQK